MTTGIEVQALTKWFGDHRAVKGIDFSVPEGEVVALLGPSGCGKTTTLRSIAGLEDPSSGRITIAGREVYSSESNVNMPSERRGVGLVFQSYALWPHLTVGQNVAYGLKVLGVKKPEIARRTEEILKAVELSGFDDRYPGSLSGGQQQRVALARSLVMEPRVLLFDEPLSNLDSKLRESMRHDLRKLVMRIGLTAVYVTHDQSEAMVIADRIILMKDGAIEQVDAPRDMYHRPKSEFAASFIGSANFFDSLVVDRRGPRALLELAPGERLWATVDGTDLAIGDSARVAVRPEKFEFTKSDNAPNSLRGSVADAEFLGSHTNYEISCGELNVTVQNSNDGFARGDAVSVSVDESDLIILEA